MNRPLAILGVLLILLIVSQILTWRAVVTMTYTLDRTISHYGCGNHYDNPCRVTVVGPR